MTPKLKYFIEDTLIPFLVVCVGMAAAVTAAQALGNAPRDTLRMAADYMLK